MPFRIEPKQSYIIRINQMLVPISPANGTEFTLEEMQKAVGGSIELACTLPDGHTLWCDEEGKLKGKQPNFWATLIHAEVVGGDVVVGDCLLIAKGQVS